MCRRKSHLLMSFKMIAVHEEIFMEKKKVVTRANMDSWTGAIERRRDAKTAGLVAEAVAIQARAGGDLGYFAAQRHLAEHQVHYQLAIHILDRVAWRDA
jgi:hypothetical protein